MLQLLLLIFFFLQMREILAPELHIDLRRRPKTAEAQTRANVCASLRVDQSQIDTWKMRLP
jgi:hypothetical protein